MMRCPALTAFSAFSVQHPPMTGSILQTAAARLDYLGDVQNLLARNLANIDTPGFQPLSAVSFSDYLGNADAGIPMLQNDAGDLPGIAAAPAAANPVAAPAGHSPDGNAVSLDQQLVQVSNNETNQQLTTSLYQVYMDMFKTALGSAGA
jgi:flagellar basal-body rod protein FlgB